MLTSYLTIKDYGEASINIRKSEFIGYIRNVETEDFAMEFIEQIRKKNWNATHNCYAYIIGENDEIQKANDDGEPSGTAGKPILEAIKKNYLKDTIIVVTRYFGGIKLGTGGLIRAYGQAASEVIQSTGIIQRTLNTNLAVTIEYPLLGKVENSLNNKGYKIKDINYLEKVTLYVLVEYGFEDDFEKYLINLTNDQVNTERIEQIYLDIPYIKNGA